jgi:hypothetical protein
VLEGTPEMFVVLEGTPEMFVVLEGTPEMFTDFYNTKSKMCTCLISIPKSIRIFCHFSSPDFTYAFPHHAILC